jgi:hypothetical protein
MFGIIALEVVIMDSIPVQCITIMKHDQITPIRVKYEIQDESHVVKVDRILARDKKKVFANMNQPQSIEYSFKCETIQGNVRKPFTLIYNNQSCKWHMFI